MNSGLFVRDDETLETMSKSAYVTLNEKLNSGDVSAFQWGKQLVVSAMEHGLTHNDTVYPDFYRDLVESIKDQVQSATERDITIGSLLAYLDKIELDGFYPVVTFRPGILSAHLMDMEPTFMLYCKEEKICPVSQPVLRVSVSQYGVLHFQLFDTSWLTTPQKATTAAPEKPTPKTKAGKPSKKAAASSPAGSRKVRG